MGDTYSIESQETPELDQAVEVSEGNIHRDERNVGRVAEEVAPELDGFAEDKSPHGQCDEQGLPVIARPLL